MDNQIRMNRRPYLLVAVLLIAGLLAVVGWYYWNVSTKPVATNGSTNTGDQTSGTPSAEEAAVRAVVTDFGRVMRNVPIGAPQPVLSEAVKKYYSPLLVADLSKEWQQNMTQSLGRLTLSPWPDRIEINNVTRGSATRYMVNGDIVELTRKDLSGTTGTRRVVEFTVDKVGDAWLIAGAAAGESHVSSGRLSFIRPDEFRFSYPIVFSIETGDDVSGGFLSQHVVQANFPRDSFEQGTNFGEAYVAVSRSATGTVATCTNFSDVRSVSAKGTTQTIAGVQFRKRTAIGAAAGTRYDHEIYRAVNDGRCYEIVLTVSTGNIGNYDPPVRAFDKERAFRVLREIVGTFRFE